MSFTARVTTILPSLPDKVNILIDETGRALLADFGMLSIISDPKYLLSSSSQTQGGTTRWMSPERIDPERFGLKDGRPTIPSDCYALGMVIYETISGNLPFHKHADPTVLMKVMVGERPPRGPGFTKDLWGMLEHCWAAEPNIRPRIEDVHQCLEMAPDSSEPSSPGADEEMDVDDGGWGTATSSSGGDSPDPSATEDRVQLPPIHSSQYYHPTHGQGPPPDPIPAAPGPLPSMGAGTTPSLRDLTELAIVELTGDIGDFDHTFQRPDPGDLNFERDFAQWFNPDGSVTLDMK